MSQTLSEHCALAVWIAPTCPPFPSLPYLFALIWTCCVCCVCGRYTSGTFVRRFLSLAESKGGASRSLLLSLAGAKNGKHMTPLEVARTPMLRCYLQKVLDKGSAPPTAQPRHNPHNHTFATSMRF